MKRMKGLFILSILSLFLGVIPVTSYADSGSLTVEVGVQFTEEEDRVEDTSSSSYKNTESERIQEETNETLPKTSEQQVPLLTVVGLICLMIVMIVCNRTK